jgi:mannose-6-phosphate isomerase-like protein (cupin superfamily)
MRTPVQILALALLVALASGASDSIRAAPGAVPRFALWRSAELRQRDERLSAKVGPDHSARETLEDFKTHRFRMLYRDADGFPEQHDRIVDVVVVQSGEGTLLLGGKMIGTRAGGGEGEYVGTGIEGGERHPIGAGDVIHIPPKVPHSFLVPKGGHITYILVKFPGE